MKRDILYVDDEIENLIVFQATFRRLSENSQAMPAKTRKPPADMK